jgi:hypothetical protein
MQIFFSSKTSIPQLLPFSKVGALFEYAKFPMAALNMILVPLGTTNVSKFFSVDECAVT